MPLRRLDGAPLAPSLVRAHVTQVPSPWNPAAPAVTGNCGPASVVIALRLLGREVPGAASHRGPQEAIDAVRLLATGRLDPMEATTWEQRASVLRAAGAEVQASDDVERSLAAARDGRPVLLSGWAQGPGTWHDRFTPAQVQRDGHHAVVLARDTSGGKTRLALFDPKSVVGPLEVTADEVRAFVRQAQVRPEVLDGSVDIRAAIASPPRTA